MDSARAQDIFEEKVGLYYKEEFVPLFEEEQSYRTHLR